MPRREFEETQLDVMAREMVGDGQSPNMFFVSRYGKVIMATEVAKAAHDFWVGLSRSNETALEDRWNGTISQTAPVEDGSAFLQTYDDYFSKNITILGERE